VLACKRSAAQRRARRSRRMRLLGGCRAAVVRRSWSASGAPMKRLFRRALHGANCGRVI